MAGTKIADVFIAISGDLTNYNRSIAQAQAGATQTGTNLGQTLGASLGRAIVSPASLGGVRGFQGQAGAILAEIPANFAKDLLTVGGAGLNGLLNIGKTVFGALKSVARDVAQGFVLGFGIGGFLALEQVISRLVQEIPNLIDKGQAYAEAAQTVSIATGATVEASSKLLGTYTLLGGTYNDLITKVDRLAVTIKTREADFNAFGVVTRDVNGNFLDQVMLLDNMRQALNQLPDGIKKTQLELLAFGRNGATALGPLLNYLGLSNTQIDAITKNLEANNLVITDSQAKLGREFEISKSNIENSLTGLGVTLFTNVGPSIISFFDALAKDITDNAKKISDVIQSVVTGIEGFVEGLLGIKLSLGSFSTDLANTANQGTATDIAIVALNTDIAAQEKILKPAKDAVTAYNEGIKDSVKAIDAQVKSIDAQIAAINKEGTAEAAEYTRANAGLQRKLDLQIANLNATDKAIALAEQAAADQRSLEQAQDAVGKAQIALLSAQAKYREDQSAAAQVGKAPDVIQTTLAQDILAIQTASQAFTDAQQGVANVHQSIADNVRKTAEDARRQQIADLKAYVTNVEKIVTDSEDKKAALTTLQKRKVVLEDEIAKDKQTGNAQALADDSIRLAAVEKAIDEEGRKSKQAVAVDKLTAFKTELEAEKALLQDSTQNATAIAQAAAAKKLADDKKQLASLQVIADKEKAQADAEKQYALDYGGIIKTTFDSGGVVPKAFKAAEKSGLDFANNVKTAISSLIDLVLGSQQTRAGGLGPPVGGRSGGLLGALQDIAGAFTSIGTGFTDILSGLKGFDPKLVGLAVAAAGVWWAQPELVAGGLALYGITAALQGGPKTPGAASRESAGSSASLPGGGLGVIPPDFSQPTQSTSSAADFANARESLAFIAKALTPNARWPYNPAESFAQAATRIAAELAAGQFTLHGRASGGWVGQHGPEIALVGEKGPEYINPSGSSPGGGAFSMRVDFGPAFDRLFGQRFFDVVGEGIALQQRRR